MKKAVFSGYPIRCYSDGNKYKDSFENTYNHEKITASKYRVPYSERNEFWYSALSLFGSKKMKPPQLYRYNLKYFKSWLNDFGDRKLKIQQQYLKERHNALGTDLAAAHFIVYRGGSVKFCGHNDWVTHGKEEYDDNLPRRYDPKFYVEALDLSGTNIIYEGLVNIFNLKNLKWLSFKNCPYFDDWCLDRISGAYCDNLEYLDVSNTKVTDRGISAIYRMYKLNTLNVHNISSSATFKLTCLMLEDINPNIKIEGVSHVLQNEGNLNQIKN